jgi:hypothetical protein
MSPVDAELVGFGVTFIAAALVAIGVGMGPWRRQDRRLARLAALSTLIGSPVVTSGTLVVTPSSGAIATVSGALQIAGLNGG